MPSIIAMGGLVSGLLAWPLARDGIGIGKICGCCWTWARHGAGRHLLLSLGPQYIPASHVTLIMMLEMLLAPFWVWMVLREAPSVTTVLRWRPGARHHRRAFLVTAARAVRQAPSYIGWYYLSF